MRDDWDPSDDADHPEPDDDGELFDGDADAVADIACPYCGEVVEISLDPAGGSVQEYVEDCQVCCRPWRVLVRYADDGRAEVSVLAEGE